MFCPVLSSPVRWSLWWPTYAYGHRQAWARLNAARGQGMLWLLFFIRTSTEYRLWWSLNHPDRLEWQTDKRQWKAVAYSQGGRIDEKQFSCCHNVRLLNLALTPTRNPTPDIAIRNRGVVCCGPNLDWKSRGKSQRRKQLSQWRLVVLKTLMGEIIDNRPVVVTWIVEPTPTHTVAASLSLNCKVWPTSNLFVLIVLITDCLSPVLPHFA